MNNVYKSKSFKFVIFLLILDFCLGVFCAYAVTTHLKNNGFGKLQIIALCLFLGYNILLFLGVFVVAFIKGKIKKKSSAPVNSLDKEKAITLMNSLNENLSPYYELKIIIPFYKGMLKRISKGFRIDISYKQTVIDVLEKYISDDNSGYISELYSLLNNNIDTNFINRM